MRGSRARISFLVALAIACALPLWGRAVSIDDRDVLLNSGSTLEAAIAAGTLSGNNPTAATFTIDSDATGTEPTSGSGYCIGGGSGPVCWLWDSVTNYLAFTGPAGMRISLPDPGDALRGLVSLDNATEMAAPASGSTALYPLGGEWYKKDNGDGTTERLIYNDGNHGVISRTVTPFVHTGTITRTPVWSYALPDATLGTTREVRVTITGTYLNSGTTGALRPHLVFGGTTWWSDDEGTLTDADTRNWSLTFTLRNTTNESTQIGNGSLFFASITSGATQGYGILAGGNNFTMGIFRGTSAIATASGGADTIALDVTLPNTEATCVFTMETATVELL